MKRPTARRASIPIALLRMIANIRSEYPCRFSHDYFIGGRRSYQITCTNASGAVTRTVALP